MPNVRASNKRGISVYVPDEIKAALANEALARGIPLSQLVTQIYVEAIKHFGAKTKKENHHG